MITLVHSMTKLLAYKVRQQIVECTEGLHLSINELFVQNHNLLSIALEDCSGLSL